MRARLAAGLALVLVAAALVAAGAADATQRWPGGTIAYVNEAGHWRWSVARAVAEWNRLGLPVRFVPARSRDEAELVISEDRSLPVPGRSTVGYYPGFTSRLWLAPPTRSPGSPGIGDRYTMARVTAHELGHVLGLHHVESCSLMYHTTDLRTGTELTCPPPDPGRWRCRFFEPGDLRRIGRLYSVRVRAPRGPDECDRWGVPDPATRASATAPTAAAATIRWRNPRSQGFAAVLVNRRAGACPTSPTDPLARVVAERGFGPLGSQSVPRAGARDEATDGTLDEAGGGPGRYCYAVWAGAASGRFARRAATARVDVPGAPTTTATLPSVGELRARVTHRRGLPVVTLTWRAPYGLGVEGLLVARAPSCEATGVVYTQERLDAGSPGQRGRFVDDVGRYGPNGIVCYQVWTVGANGPAPWPATVRAAVVPKRPLVPPRGP
ncbi:MAG: matrixin family metalloprotease [Thermoleophilia bacterium]